MRLLTYVPPKFSVNQLEILARHNTAKLAEALGNGYAEYSFNVLSNDLRQTAEGRYNVVALYRREYR
jgi:uncharacterized protein YfeS